MRRLKRALASLSSAAEVMYNTRKELLLLGDFDMDMYHQSEEGRFPNRNLVNFCERFFLANKIFEPTRVTDKTKTLVDGWKVPAAYNSKTINDNEMKLGGVVKDH